jgi:hypothetical protein
MGALGERAVQLAEGGEDRPGLHDRVHAEVRARAVRGPAGDLDVGPHESLVRDDQLELGRLGDDRGVGAGRPEHLLDADARVLLVGDRGDDDVPGQAERGGLAAGDERRGDPGLHVVRAAAVEPVALDARRVRVAHAPDGDRVEMAAEQQRPPAARARRAHDDARTARSALEHLCLEPGGARPLGDERGDLALPRAARHERGVHGVDRDERGREVPDVAHRPRARRIRSSRSARSASVRPGS